MNTERTVDVTMEELLRRSADGLAAERPERPMVPVGLPMLGVAIGASRLVLVGRLGLAASAIGVAVLGAWLAGRRRMAVAVCVAGAMVLCTASVGVVRGEGLAGELARGGVRGWEFEVLADASETRFGWRCRARARLTGGGRPGLDEASCEGTPPTGEGPSATAGTLAGGWPPAGLPGPSGDVWLSLDEPATYGDVLEVVGSFAPNGEDEWGLSSSRQGVWGQVHVRSVRVRRQVAGLHGLAVDLRGRALDMLDAGSGEGRALLAGCVCGRRVELRDRGLDDLFSACGVAHLLAVSGGHIAVVSALVGGLCLRFGLRPTARGLASAGLSGLFVLCCGAPASAIRSWLMAVAGVAAGIVGRREHALSSVCLAALGMALADPGVTGQLGFLLSVGSVVALCLFSSYASYAARVLVPIDLGALPLPWRVRGALAAGLASARASLATSLVCQLATLGLVAQAFGQVSLVGPVAGLLVGPLFTPLVSLGSVAAALASLPGAGGACTMLLACCDVLAGMMLACLRWLRGWPLATVAVGGSWGVWLVVATGMLVALLYLRWPEVRRRAVLGCAGMAGAVLALLLVRWRWLAPARIVVLDVGQGDAILVQDGAAAVLVDTGPEGALAEALAREHVLHLDAVVLTHLHADHYGGVADLVGTVGTDALLVGEGAAAQVDGELEEAVGELLGEGDGGWDAILSLLAGLMADDDAGGARVDVAAGAGAARDDGAGGDAQGLVGELSYGDELHVGGWVLRVVWPREPRTGTANADSLELLATYERDGRTLTVLLTGDAEREETGAVIAAGDVGDIDLLKVGHHGSAVSLTAAEAEALDAEVAVASAGEGNRYGHPTAECLELLERSGSLFLCTIDAGDVCVEPGRDGPVVHTQRGGGAMGWL